MLLNISEVTGSFLYRRHVVILKSAWDPRADVLEINACNRGLVAGIWGGKSGLSK